MPRERKVSKKTCEAGKVVEVTISLHPEAFKLVEQLRKQGMHGVTDALVCTGLVLEGLRAMFPPSLREDEPATAEDRAARVESRRRAAGMPPKPRKTDQPRLGMTFKEIRNLEFGRCAHEDETGPDAYSCACDVCSLIGSLVCKCGVFFIDHDDDPEFSLASWTAIPGIEPPSEGKAA